MIIFAASPIKTIVGTFASAEGANEENFEILSYVSSKNTWKFRKKVFHPSKKFQPTEKFVAL